MDRLRPALVALSSHRGLSMLRLGCLAGAVAVGALDAWFYRDWNANPDGVSYIDMARAFAARGPSELINGYWSPLYPALIGVGFKLLSPPFESQYAMVRGLGFIIYIVAALSFARLVSIVLARRVAPADEPSWVPPAFIVGAWALFYLLVSQATGLHLVTPDIGVAAIVFFAAAELLSLARDEWNAARWIRFGAVLAIGYWWKAILFPVGGLALVLAIWIAWRRGDRRRVPAATGLASFAGLALLVAIPVSSRVGRPTFGETGRVNQLWYVSHVPMVGSLCLATDGQLPRGELGSVDRETVGLATPLTCTTRASVPEATLPLWYDPAPYFANVHTKLDLGETAVAVRNDIRFLREALAEWLPFTALGLGVLILAGLVARARLAGGAPLILFCVVPIAAYLVVYVELRHVVPFIVCVGVAAIIGLADRAATWSRAVLAAFTVVAVLESAGRIVTQQRTEAAITVNRFLGRDTSEQRSAIAARELIARGLVAGDAVATINTMWNVDWAQRAGLVVRAYVPEYTYPIDRALRELGDACTREAFLGALRAQRIKAVVLREVEGFDAPAWLLPLGESGYRAGIIGAPDATLSCPATR